MICLHTIPIDDIELHQGNQYHSTTEMILKREEPIFNTEIPME